MGMDGAGLLHPVLVLALALVVGALLVLAARTVRVWQRVLLRLLEHVLSRRAAAVVRVALTGLLVVLVLDVIVAERAFGAIEAGSRLGTRAQSPASCSRCRSHGPVRPTVW